MKKDLIRKISVDFWDNCLGFDLHIGPQNQHASMLFSEFDDVVGMVRNARLKLENEYRRQEYDQFEDDDNEDSYCED